MHWNIWSDKVDQLRYHQNRLPCADYLSYTSDDMSHSSAAVIEEPKSTPKRLRNVYQKCKIEPQADGLPMESQTTMSTDHSKGLKLTNNDNNLQCLLTDGYVSSGQMMTSSDQYVWSMLGLSKSCTRRTV